MEYPSGDWKFCRCGGSYYVYDDCLDSGRCDKCANKIHDARAKERRRVKRLESENKRLKKKLKEVSNG